MLNLIVAPKNHNFKAEKFTKKIVKFLKTNNVEYSVYFSVNYTDVTDSVKELYALGETEFVIVGDDIIINEFLNSLKDLNKIKLGIIPTNKNDDFAKYLELETDPILAIKQILKKKITEIDLMLVNEKRVINNLIIGAGVEVEEQFSQFKWKSIFTKEYAKRKVNNSYTGQELTISSKNNKAKTINVYELVVANGGNSKGKPVSPLSNVKDGLLNLLYVEATQDKTNSKTFKLFEKGNHIYEEQTTQLWLPDLKITSADKKIKALIDGRIYNFDKLDITVVENGIKLYK